MAEHMLRSTVLRRAELQQARESSWSGVERQGLRSWRWISIKLRWDESGGLLSWFVHSSRRCMIDAACFEHDRHVDQIGQARRAEQVGHVRQR